MSVWPFARLWGMMRFTVSHAHCVRASLSSSVDIQKCYDLPFVQVFCDWQHYMSHWDSWQLLWHLMFEQIAFYSTITLFAQFSCHLRSLSSSAFATSLCFSILNMPHWRCLQCFQVLSTVVNILTCANFKHWALAHLFFTIVKCIPHSNSCILQQKPRYSNPRDLSDITPRLIQEMIGVLWVRGNEEWEMDVGSKKRASNGAPDGQQPSLAASTRVIWRRACQQQWWWWSMIDHDDDGDGDGEVNVYLFRSSCLQYLGAKPARICDDDK